ncbi:MAG: hypothetical protein AB1512_18955 [Thermodesulfobacteriota bacterium]
MLKHEWETLSFPLSIHPLDRYRDRSKNLDYVRARDLPCHVGRWVTRVHRMVTGKTVHTKDDGLVKSPGDTTCHFDRREKSSIFGAVSRQDFSLCSK